MGDESKVKLEKPPEPVQVRGVRGLLVAAEMRKVDRGFMDNVDAASGVF